MFKKVLKYNHNHGPDGRFSSGSDMARAFAEGLSDKNKKRVDDQLDTAFAAALEGKANFRREVGRIVEEQSRPNPFSVDQIRNLRAMRREAEAKDIWRTERTFSFRELLGLKPYAKAHGIKKFNPNHDDKGLFSTGKIVAKLNAGEKTNIPAEHLSAVLHTMSAHEDQHPNLMHATVDGKPVFSHGNLGMKREDMPQIPSEHLDRFMQGLGEKVTMQSLDPAALKPTQGQIDGHKVGRIYEKYKNGTGYTKPIIVSRDGYVIDGHHHWGGTRALRVHDKGVRVPAFHINMSQKEVLAAAQAYTDAHGIKRKDITKEELLQSIATVLKYNPNHDQIGRFATGAQGSFRAVDSLVNNMKTRQDDHTPEALYAKANQAHAEMEELLNKGKGVASQLGYQTMKVPPEKADLTEPGGMLFIAPLKNKDTAAEKVRAEYGGDWSKLLDATRATIAVDKVKDIKTVADKLKEAGIKVTRVKNRFEKPVNGYRDALLNLEFSNGHIGELQLHVKPLLRAKNTGHKFYENQRSISHKYPKGTPISEYTKQDRRRYAKEVMKQMDLYNDAWEHAG